MSHSKFCFNKRSRQFHVLLGVKEHQKFLNLPAYNRFQVQQSYKQSPHQATLVDSYWTLAWKTQNLEFLSNEVQKS